MNIKKKIYKELNKIFKYIKINKKYDYKIQQNKKFSDYQINGIIEIIKKQKINKEYIFKIIEEKFKKKKIFKKINIIEPGFINIFINKKEIEKIINKYTKIKNFGIKNKKKQNIVIDYSSPNAAKEMHIGHLRSTILGDSIANILKFLGNKIIRINHIGDWGTQFGMIIAWIKKYEKNKKINNIISIEKIYQKAQKKFSKNKKFAKISRKYVVKLQNKKSNVIKIWKKIIKLTIRENQKIYKKLNIKLKKKNIIGESFYQKFLPNIIKDLLKKKIAKKKNKTVLVFTKNKKKTNAIVIKKKDGGYLYSTTDIASIKYRCKKFNAQKIIYLIDSRQKLYLNQIFSIVKKAKYIPKKTKLIHYNFGTILNKKGKPFKTRKGKNIKLKKIIKKTISVTKKIISNKKKYNKKKIKEISLKVAISAIKYYDLSKNRIKNYIFDINKMLSLKENTGPYMQYAYTRIISILKKNNTNITKSIQFNKFKILNNTEFKICKEIMNLEEIIILSSKGYPHIMCHYLYKITLLFSNFYETNRINKIKNIEIKNSKLKLIAIIAKIIKICLKLLGIQVLNKI